MNRSIALLIILTFSLFSWSQNFSFVDGKAYKIVQSFTTLNVNSFDGKFADGDFLTVRDDAIRSSKYLLERRATGRKDFEGNDITLFVLTSKERNDSIYIYPRFEMYPNQYHAFYHDGDNSLKGLNIHSGVSDYYDAYPSENICLVATQGSYNDIVGKKGNANLESAVRQKVGYDKKDLIEAHRNKKFEAYKKFIEDHQNDPKNFDYMKLINKYANDWIFSYDENTYNHSKVKITKHHSANGQLDKIQFTIPFEDGRYPEKEDFQIYANRTSNGIFVITDGKNVIDEGTIYPFNDVLIIVRKNGTISKGFLYNNVIDRFRYEDLADYSGSGEYEAAYKYVMMERSYEYEKDKLRFNTYLREAFIQGFK